MHLRNIFWRFSLLQTSRSKAHIKPFPFLSFPFECYHCKTSICLAAVRRTEIGPQWHIKIIRVVDILPAQIKKKKTPRAGTFLGRRDEDITHTQWWRADSHNEMSAPTIKWLQWWAVALLGPKRPVSSAVQARTRTKDDWRRRTAAGGRFPCKQASTCSTFFKP